MKRYGILCNILVSTVLWGMTCRHSALAEDRLSVAEELVRELRELELAVAKKEVDMNMITTAPMPETTPETSEDSTTTSSNSDSADSADTDSSESADSDDSADSSDPADIFDEIMDNVDEVMENAVSNVKEELDDLVEEEESEMEDAEDTASEDMDTAVQKAEQEMEDARDRFPRRGRDRGNRRDRPQRPTREERQKRRMERRQRRALERVANFLQKQLVLLKKIPQDSRDPAFFGMLQRITDMAMEQLSSKNQTTTMAPMTEPTTSGSPEGEMSAEDVENDSDSTTTPSPAVTRQLRRLLRLLAEAKP